MKATISTIIIILATISQVYAQKNKLAYMHDFLFSYISVEEGLPNNFVDDIYKDKQGFIWIATSGGGLLRYDGYDFKHINVNSQGLSIKSNFVRKVTEDDFHRLWVCSEAGIDILNLNNINDKTIIPFNDELQHLVQQPSTCAYKDSRGCIWLSFPKTIVKLDFDNKGAIGNVRILDNPPPTNNPVASFCEFGDQMVVAFANKLYMVQNGVEGKLIVKQLASNLNLDCNSINALLENNNEIWIGTDNGLFRYNPITETIKIYRHSETDKNSITQDLISDIKTTSDNNIVISTLRGLNIYNPQTDNFITFQQDEKAEPYKTLNCNFINCILCEGRTIWIGTELCGLNKMSVPYLNIENIEHHLNNKTSISNGAVNSVFLDSDNNLWVGCIEGGLNYRPANSNEFTHFTTANGLSHNSVSEIIQIDDKLWLATWGYGITIFDKKLLKVTGYINTQNTGCHIDFVGSMIRDTINNGVWVGSNRGIYFYDFSTNKMTAPLPESIESGVHGCLGTLITSKGELWMGYSNGIVRVDLNSFKKNRSKFIFFNDIPQESDYTTTFLSKSTCFLETSDGSVYIGTGGYGFVKSVNINGKLDFMIYNSSNGLCNDVVAQLVEDNLHNIWIATSHGVSCFAPYKERFTNYYKQNGLCSNQFFWNGNNKKCVNGHILLGSVCGLVDIDTDNSSRGIYSQNNKVVLTNLLVDDKIVLPGSEILNKDLAKAEKIALHERNKTIQIEFSSLDYQAASTVVYQYRLIGFNSDKWTTVEQNRRFANYTNLHSGKYVFQVRCASGPDDFSDITSIQINIEPYFYKSWWFIITIVVLIIFAIYRIERWRVQKIQRQKSILERKVEQRTSAIENQKVELAKQNEILSQQNEEILQQKTQLEQMTKKIQDLTVDKLAFFTNITHEFRTPVTLITGPIERALKLSTNPQVIEQLKFVEKNSQHLLTLVNQLLDFRKVESDSMPVSYSPGNVMTFMEDILLPFRALTKDKKISLKYYHRIASPYIMFDREAMTKIITNLLGNAVKYTNEGGTIALFAALLHKPDRLYICVSDTGQGIVTEDIDKIFNRFYQSHTNYETNVKGQTGTGIGLYLSKRLAKLLEGDITAKNNRTKGASFRLIIPYKKAENEPRKLQNNQQINFQDIEIDDNTDNIEENTPSKLTILVVEDNLDMRHYIRSILSDTYDITEAGDGKEALEILHSSPVDFIISDLMMPEMDGLQLVKKVKADFAISHIPFLMLTAKTARDAQLESFQSGVDDYILKPFDETMLKTRIASILENRSRFQQRFKNEMLVDNLNISEDSSDKKFIDKAIKIVKENYQNSYYEVADFVEAMGVSRSLLNKKMQTLTGQSAGQFIRNYRLNVAREMILKNRITKNMNISEIAYEVGFNDPKYFTRCFTKHFSTTPSAMMETN